MIENDDPDDFKYTPDAHAFEDFLAEFHREHGRGAIDFSDLTSRWDKVNGGSLHLEALLSPQTTRLHPAAHHDRLRQRLPSQRLESVPRHRPPAHQELLTQHPLRQLLARQSARRDQLRYRPRVGQVAHRIARITRWATPSIGPPSTSSTDPEMYPAAAESRK